MGQRDAQVLFDPLEEQLDLPSALVKRGNGQRRQEHVVGEEHQGLSGTGIFEADAPQMLGIPVAYLPRVVARAARVFWGALETQRESLGVTCMARPSNRESRIAISRRLVCPVWEPSGARTPQTIDLK